MSVQQIGANGGADSLTAGTAYVAVLTNPYETSTLYSMMLLMVAILSIVAPLVFLRHLLDFVDRIF